MTGSLPTLIAVAVYLVAGVVVAVALSRRGQTVGTAFSALVIWPFLVPLFLSSKPAATPGGPCGERIDSIFDSLLQTLEDPASNDLPWAANALELRAALHRADKRLAFVDRLLDDVGEQATGATADSLRDARDHAAAEIDAVLAAVAQLRLQVGLLTLAGDAVPVQDRLSELLARADALLEVHDAGYAA